MNLMMYRTEAIYLSILSVMSKLMETVRFMAVEDMKTFTHTQRQYNSFHILLVNLGKT